MCRTYNGGDVNANEEYFYKIIKHLADTGEVNDSYLYSHAQKDGRGNICPVTIIMPTIAMNVLEKKFKALTSDYKEMVNLAHENKEEISNLFIKALDKKIDEAKDMLIERFNHIADQSPKAASFMYSNKTMAGYVPEEGIISALKHGTLALGNLGLAETLQILLGCDHTDPEGMQLAHRIYSLYNKKCTEFKTTYSLNFGVYNTPKLLWAA